MQLAVRSIETLADVASKLNIYFSRQFTLKYKVKCGDFV